MASNVFYLTPAVRAERAQTRPRASRQTHRALRAPAAVGAPEPFGANDQRNIGHVVWLIAHWFRMESAWVHAVWFALRRATGVPSPQRFNASHLPALAAELRRIWVAAEALSKSMREAEAEFIKHVIRRGDEAEPLLAESRANWAAIIHADRAELGETMRRWNEAHLAAITDRTPAVAYHPESEEPLSSAV